MGYQYLIFDLDNTLYAKDSGMLQHIDERIDIYMKKQLHMPAQKITCLREAYWKEYGTTLGGMITQWRTDPDDYIKYTYGIKVRDFIREDLQLQKTLSRIDLPKIVFSNSPGDYVSDVLNVLGVRKHFLKIYDIRFCQYLGKPNLSSFQKVLNDLKTEAGRCIFVDDTLENIIAARRIGMETLWLSDQHGPNSQSRIEAIYDIESVVNRLMR